MASYTHPELRERLKHEITQGDRGGKPGLWSARKAQLLAREYEDAGGGYNGPKDAGQQHLEAVAGEPLPGFDALTAKDLLSKLGDLEPADLEAVRDYEQAHKARKTVLDRIARSL